MFPTPFSGDSDLGRSALIEVETGELNWLNEERTGASSPSFDPTSKRVAYVYRRDGDISRPIPYNVRM